MHELSIAQALVRQVEAEARQHVAVAVRALSVRIGALSGVEPELLETAYAVCRAGTLCADAELRVVGVPARWHCVACDRDVDALGGLRCAACGQPASLAGGDELILDRIELEVADV